MPWKDVSTLSLRTEFVALAQQPDANVSLLARRFGISRKTASQWLGRAAAGGPDPFADRPRRPHTCYPSPRSIHTPSAPVQSVTASSPRTRPPRAGRPVQFADGASGLRKVGLPASLPTSAPPWQAGSSPQLS